MAIRPYGFVETLAASGIRAFAIGDAFEGDEPMAMRAILILHLYLLSESGSFAVRLKDGGIARDCSNT